VALVDSTGADRLAIHGAGSVAVNAEAASSLQLLHGDMVVVDINAAAVVVASERTANGDSSFHLSSGSSGAIAVTPGRGTNGQADGKLVFQDAAGGAVMESTGEGSFHVYEDIIFDGDTLSVSADNRVGIGTTAPSSEHAFDVSDHMSVTARLSVADALHVDASRHSVGVGTGSSTPSAVLDVVASSGAGHTLDVIGMGNVASATQMHGTSSSARFTQVYDGAARSTTARLLVGSETDWTAHATSADSYLVVQTTQSSAEGERFRVDSSGSSALHGDVTVGGECQ